MIFVFYYLICYRYFVLLSNFQEEWDLFKMRYICIYALFDLKIKRLVSNNFAICVENYFECFCSYTFYWTFDIGTNK